METIVNWAADLVAAILAKLGIVGRARRRGSIHEDLKLLTEIGDHATFGRESWPHMALADHVALEIGKYAGVDFKQRRKVAWGSVFLALIIGAPFGYLTYKLNESGFTWYSIFPGFVALMMFTAVLGMIFAPEPEAPELDEAAAGELGTE